jgi:ABC-2 type transport system ATP-binding protein
VLGPNGAGKSTLVKMLTGLLAPNGGSVSIASLDPVKQVLALRRGLFDALTIQEHLEMCGPIYGPSAAETRERAGPLLRNLGLEQGRYTFAAACSHGMRKKTAFAMALLHNPKVLFLDEPFEGIDPVSSKTIRDLLTTISARGVTIFLTSHILSIVDRIATEIMLIRGGQIVWLAPAGEIPRPTRRSISSLSKPPTSRTFLGCVLRRPERTEARGCPRPGDLRIFQGQ